VQYERRRYSGRDAYAQSKQADRMLSWALARRLLDRGITVNALHPGFVATEIFAKGGGLAGMAASLYSKLRARTPEQGADTVVYLAASPELDGRSGLFWIDRQERRCRFRDEEQEERLYRLCREMTRPT
jgi:NAD(P)-dependent dehydrogenase (short-subunit alcohol dehydrogenase family)